MQDDEYATWLRATGLPGYQAGLRKAGYSTLREFLAADLAPDDLMLLGVPSWKVAPVLTAKRKAAGGRAPFGQRSANRPAGYNGVQMLDTPSKMGARSRRPSSSSVGPLASQGTRRVDLGYGSRRPSVASESTGGISRRNRPPLDADSYSGYTPREPDHAARRAVTAAARMASAASLSLSMPSVSASSSAGSKLALAHPELHRLFTTHDADGNGMLAFREYNNLLRSEGQAMLMAQEWQIGCEEIGAIPAFGMSFEQFVGTVIVGQGSFADDFLTDDIDDPLAYGKVAAAQEEGYDSDATIDEDVEDVDYATGGTSANSSSSGGGSGHTAVQTHRVLDVEPEPESALSDAAEQRVDPSDGKFYTFSEQQRHYGADAQRIWDEGGHLMAQQAKARQQPRVERAQQQQPSLMVLDEEPEPTLDEHETQKDRRRVFRATQKRNTPSAMAPRDAALAPERLGHSAARERWRVALLFVKCYLRAFADGATVHPLNNCGEWLEDWDAIRKQCAEAAAAAAVWPELKPTTLVAAALQRGFASLGSEMGIEMDDEGKYKVFGEMRPWRQPHSSNLQPPPPLPPLPGSKFREYESQRFERIRRHFGVDELAYQASLAGPMLRWGGKEVVGVPDLRLVGAGTLGSRSPAYFFFSPDQRFVIKLARTVERDLLLSILDDYADRIDAAARDAASAAGGAGWRRPHTLLPQIYGLYTVRVDALTSAPDGTGRQLFGGTKLHFYVMANIFCTKLRLDYRFDLKGSRGKNRGASESELRKGSGKRNAHNLIIVKGGFSDFKRAQTPNR
eukprot:SAG11_NODE_1121_length_5789_cov_2.695079_6_plen_793_part_00